MNFKLIESLILLYYISILFTSLSIYYIVILLFYIFILIIIYSEQILTGQFRRLIARALQPRESV